MGPIEIDARRYARVVKQRLEEAKLIFRILELSAAAQYLGGYAVECILKALVLTLTPQTHRPKSGDSTVEWMKKEFGHELGNLRLGIAKRGAPMPRETDREFVFVATWDPQSRYDPGPGDPEQTKRFLSAAEAVVKWASGRV
jgi:hypothetical protein